VLANISISYLSPVTFPSELLIGTGLKQLGNTSITSFQAIYERSSKKLVSVAEAAGVWFDLEKQRPARLPEIEHKTAYFVNFENS